jgi:hypothetical protein
MSPTRRSRSIRRRAEWAGARGQGQFSQRLQGPPRRALLGMMAADARSERPVLFGDVAITAGGPASKGR